jgi:hypothetical protein
MPGSTLPAFGEPNDYQAALRGESGFDLVVTGRGKFQAQLTRIVLSRIHLLAGEEHLSRIAYISPRPHWVRVLLPVRGGAALFWDGIACNAEEIVTHNDGQRLHERTEGPSRWRAIYLSKNELEHARTSTLPKRASRWHLATAADLEGDRTVGDFTLWQPRPPPNVTLCECALHGSSSMR